MSIRSLLVIIAAITGAQLAAAPRVATTVDFLDYAFFDSLGAADHYELSAWEQRIRELADAGISKIYLRVNVCGLTLYPTKFSAIYGANGAWHGGWVTVGGQTYYFDTKDINYDGPGQGTNPLGSVTISGVNPGVSVEVAWHFQGTYGGTELETITASGVIA